MFEMFADMPINCGRSGDRDIGEKDGEDFGIWGSSR